MDTQELIDSLAVPGFSVFIDEEDDTLYVRWTENSGDNEQFLVGLRTPGSAAEAEIKLLHPGCEWTSFLVEPWARNKGIFTTCINIPASVLKNQDMWPLYVAQNVNAADFYRSAGMKDTDDGRLVRDDKAVKAWNQRNSD